MSFNKLMTAYSSIWTCFQQAAEANGGLSAVSAQNRGVIVLKRKERIWAESCFYLPNWRYKARSDKHHIDVVVAVKEEISADFKCIVSGNTNIGYYERQSNGAELKPKAEIHYDFEHRVPEAHPAYHMQFGEARWPKSLGDLGLCLGNGCLLSKAVTDAKKAMSSVDDDKPVPYTFHSARVPTAYLGFAQVLLALAADHLSWVSFRTIALEVAASVLPEPGCHHFTGPPAVTSIPKISSWYDSRYYVTIAKPKPTAARWTAEIGPLKAVGTGTTRKGAIDDLKKKASIAADNDLALHGD